MTSSPLKIFVATSNAGKLRDFAIAAAELTSTELPPTDVTSRKRSAPVELLVLPGLGGIAAPPEDDPTFEGNARLKAIYYSHALPGEIVLADDSGLEVDALGGAPGVRSARYADDMHFEGAAGMDTDTRNNLCLLAALAAAAAVDRSAGYGSARYRCALAAARDGLVVEEAIGSVEGRIVSVAEGTGGFGYDPYFVPAGEAHTMAALSSERRMALSHRGRALQQLLRKL